jgi:GNAT superfamily N-acetyltransferase
LSSDGYTIEDLDPDYHEIHAFSCGEPLLDDALHDPVYLQGCGRTYVVVSDPKSSEILAYFTLLPDPQEVFSASAEYTAIQLNILAVDQRYQKQGIGSWILSQLIHYIVHQADTYQIDYLLIDPLDEKASQYYLALNIGFVRLQSGKLVLSIETMRQAADIATDDSSKWFENNK